MAAEAPVLVKPIPALVVNEGAACGPFNLNDFIQSPNSDSGSVQFSAELVDGRSLPQGMICTSNGTLSGIPAVGTAGNYEILVMAENESNIPFSTQFSFTIKERSALTDDTNYFTNLKSQVWEALGKDLPLPDIGNLFDRPLTAVEIQYLLERFATLTIWDAYNLEPADTKKLLDLPGVSKHYHVYDRGSCLIGVPKELFSHARTLEDALQTSRAMAREVYQRGWTIEFAGFYKMVRASWVELQLLADKHGRALEILHYKPSAQDEKLYRAKSTGPGTTPRPE